MKRKINNAGHGGITPAAILSQTEWEKFVWIEEHGSPDGFPG